MTFGALLSYIAFKLLVPGLFVLSCVVALWGIFLFIIAGDQDGGLQEKGKTLVIYGIIAFVVMALLYLLFRAIAGMAG